MLSLLAGSLKEGVHHRFFLQNLMARLAKEEGQDFTLSFGRYFLTELNDGLIPYELYDFYNVREGGSVVEGRSRDFTLQVTGASDVFLQDLQQDLVGDLSSSELFLGCEVLQQSEERFVSEGEPFSGGVYRINLSGELPERNKLLSLLCGEVTVIALGQSIWFQAHSAYILEDGLVEYLSQVASPVVAFSEGLFFELSANDLEALIV